MQTITVEGFRLSPQQRHLWQLQQHTAAYPAHCVVRVEGELDEVALREAAALTVGRYEILRTRFRRPHGILWPVQIVAAVSRPLWQSIDLCGLPAPRRAGLVEEFAAWELRGINDLEHGPTVRFLLLRIAPSEHLLVVSLPALCADDATLDNLIESLGRAYESHLTGEPVGDEPLPYAQFSEWQNGLLEDAEDAEGREFWERQDLSAASAAALPYADDARRARGFEVKSLAAAVHPDVRDGLAALAARWGVAFESLLHACWQTLLWRLTGREEIVTGQVFDGRDYEVLEGACGLFARWLPVRCRFSGRRRLADAAAELEASARAAAQWQEYFARPRDVAADETDARGDAHTPLFRFGFQFERRRAPLRFAGLTLSVAARHHYTERFDLRLRCVSAVDTLAAEFDYDPSLFGASDVRRLAEEFVTLLASAVGSPEAPLSELEIVGVEERDLLLSGWNDTVAASPSEESLAALFEEQAARTPLRPAVVAGDISLTYAELNARANQLAHHLRARGVGAESRVGMLLERSAEMVVALLAVLKAGGCYVPLDPRYPGERIAFMLEDAGASVLLTQSSLAETLPAGQAGIVRLDAEWPAVAGLSAENPPPTPAADLAYVIYTSGSTGKPKGVMIEHGSVINLWGALSRAIYGRHEAPLNVSLNAPLAFDASVKQLVQLLSGHTLHVIPDELRLDAAGLLDYAERRRLHVLDCTPAQLRLLLAAGLADRPGLELKAVLVGGEAIDAPTWETLARQASPDFYNVYGPTECTVDATACEVRAAGARPVIGRPLTNVRTYLLDARLQPAPVGVAGELYVGGSGVARGYLNRPGLTAERFVPDPFSREPGARLYRTGDRARHLTSGEIDFLGRVDQQVKVHGFRIELGEIEARLRAHDSVREAVVVARADAADDPRLVAYFVPAQSPAPAAATLRQFLRLALPEYMVPGAFVELEALPLTRHGKVDRQALPAPEAARAASESYVAPRNELEEKIARIWAEVLGVERVGVDDNFFDLGGHSLLVVQVHSRLREAFGVEVSIVELFKNPTVGSLAQFFAEGQGEQPHFRKVFGRAERRKAAANRHKQLLEERNR